MVHFHQFSYYKIKYKESLNIKKSVVILGFILILFLSIGSICATDANDNNHNETDTGLNTITDPPNPSDSQSTNSSNETPKSPYKTFSDLANEIENTKGSTLNLKGTYKFNPETDQKYTKGIIISKNIKLVGKNCILDGNGQARILKIMPNCKVTLKDMTFKNGYGKQCSGGAIYVNSGSHLIIKNCVFNNNKAYNANGGAIATDIKVNLEIQNSKFTNNYAIRSSAKKWPDDKKGMGGALFVNVASNLKIYNSNFKKNTGYLSIIVVLSQTSQHGIKTSNVYVKNTRFESNTANINGAFYLDEYGKGTFLKSIFKKNRSKDKGAALVLEASKYVLVKNCRFEQNRGVFGGALDLLKYQKKVSNVKVVDCIFKKNFAEKVGGAIFCDYGKLKISKTKFIQNKAKKSGGAIEVRNAKLKVLKAYFNKNVAECGGAILVKNKKVVYTYKCKFVKNKASEKGKNILGIIDHKIFKLKVVKKYVK